MDLSLPSWSNKSTVQFNNRHNNNNNNYNVNINNVDKFFKIITLIILVVIILSVRSSLLRFIIFNLLWYKYKRRTDKHRTLQRSDSTNVGLVQTLDQYKHRTLVEFERKDHCYKKKINKKSLTYCDKNQRQLNKVSSFEGSTV